MTKAPLSSMMLIIGIFALLFVTAIATPTTVGEAFDNYANEAEKNLRQASDLTLANRLRL